jgi:hypothetical protein
MAQANVEETAKAELPDAKILRVATAAVQRLGRDGRAVCESITVDRGTLIVSLRDGAFTASLTDVLMCVVKLDLLDNGCSAIVRITGIPRIPERLNV